MDGYTGALLGVASGPGEVVDCGFASGTGDALAKDADGLVGVA